MSKTTKEIIDIYNLDEEIKGENNVFEKIAWFSQEEVEQLRKELTQYFDECSYLSHIDRYKVSIHIDEVFSAHELELRKESPDNASVMEREGSTPSKPNNVQLSKYRCKGCGEYRYKCTCYKTRSF